jgi:Tfp pilus assembly protein PilN
MADRRSDERREFEDRRQVAERRRLSENRYAAFEVCRSTLHLALVARGEGDHADRVVTRSIRWRKEAPSLHTEAGARELTEAFQLLVAEEHLAGANTRIALNGEFCVTRVVTGPTEQVRRELGELEERSNQYLLLGPGEKVTAECSQQLDARHEHALLSVASQNVLHLLVGISASVGIKTKTIEQSLVALSRAQARLAGGVQEACLIIQLDEGEAELGVCHQGRLLLDYRPGGHADADNIAEIVAEHLGRVQRYLSRQHGNLNQTLRHVYLNGEPDVVQRASRHFAALKQFEVHIFEPGQLDLKWEYASDAPNSEYAAVIGSVLACYDPDAAGQTPNLVERVLDASRKPLRPFLLRASIPVAAALLVALALAVMSAREHIAGGQLQAKLASFAPICLHADELKLQLLATEAKLKQLHTLDSKLPKPKWGELLQHIAQSMPDDVWLDRISFRDSKNASLSGASYTDSGVYDFVSYLKQVPQIAQIDLAGTGVGHTPTGPSTSFDLELSLTPTTGSSN